MLSGYDMISDDYYVRYHVEAYERKAIFFEYK